MTIIKDLLLVNNFISASTSLVGKRGSIEHGSMIGSFIVGNSFYKNACEGVSSFSASRFSITGGLRSALPNKLPI